MWFWLALIALLCWSGSDLFSKIGCRNGNEKYNHLKMVIAVGVVMGIHAAIEIFVQGVEINLHVIFTGIFIIYRFYDTGISGTAVH